MKAALDSTADVAMQDNGLPADEAERLVSLHRLGLLDTPATVAFDGVTRLAAAALRVPIVLVSLVDQNRLWFKSRVGLALRECPRGGSFCSQAVRQRQPLMVRDAAADARFTDSALVYGPAHVRAYLGIPLYSRDRQPVGTLCAMDTEVRDFGEVERLVLSEFAKIAEELLVTQEIASKSDGVLQYAMEREKLFRETFEQAAVGIVHTSLHGAILRTNQHACGLLGYGPTELRELSFRHLTHPDDFATNVQEFKRALAGEIDSYRLEQRLRRKDQQYLWAAVSVTLKRTASRQPDYGIVVIEDLSLQKQAELEAIRVRDAAEDRLALQSRKLKEAGEALRASEGTLQSIEAKLHSTEAELHSTEAELHSTQGTLQSAEAKLQSTEAKLQFTEAELHSTEAELQSTEAELQSTEARLQATEAKLHSTEGTLHSTEAKLHSTQQALVDAEELYREAQAALQVAHAKLAVESATDALTVLPNRRSFSRRSEQAAQALRHSKKPYGLILLDLDNLKQVNEDYGHEVGDEVLRSLGNILNTQLRNSSDMAARLGGDEFAVLCFGDINEQTLHDVAERIHTQIGKEPLATPKGLLRFSGSFGLALSNADDPDWKTLFGRADAALREAKAAGKDRISFGRSQSKSATQRLRALSVPSPSV
ncbi:MAG TPA: diguanylate cyclase [Steroidobacteraceae bacterium]|nr:diguanylate cyclase [Steroidobacteraceae bacterium]